MSYRVDKLKDDQCVSVVFSGHVSEKQHYEARDAANNILTQTGWNRLIVDATEMDAEMSLTDDYKFTSEHPFILPPTVCMAILYHPDEYDRFSFIENVARNRGSNHKIFANRVDALDWLKKN